MPFEYTQIINSIPIRRNNYMTTAVHDAIEMGNLEMVILFDKYNVDLNRYCFGRTSSYQESVKKTPLRLATELHQKDIVQFLISRSQKL